LGVPLIEDSERVGIYLTNALTGWQPPDEESKQKIQQLQLSFPELNKEREAADEVKRGKPILVILGNPPYNAFAGTSPAEEAGLVEVYKQGLISDWGIKKFNLDELYVRFFRLAERCISENTGKGVVCYISNYSWVSEPSFVVLRQNLLKNFNKFWIENMHGNRKISEYAPDGRTSETIFSIPGFSAGIQQGVVISLWLKNSSQQGTKVLFRDDIDAAKAVERRSQLLESLNNQDFDSLYQVSNPEQSNRYSFRPSDVSSHYLAWPKLTDLCKIMPFNGPVERRGNSLIVYKTDRNQLELEVFR
jgi:predicted helicase